MSSGQPGRYQRSSSGLVGAVLVLLLVVAGYVVFRTLTRGNQDQPVPTVDFLPAATQARADGRLNAPAPAPMPDGWRATSVRYQNGARPTWHLGLLTDRQRYVGIEESRGRVGTLVDSYVGSDARQGPDRRVAGQTWQTWRSGTTYALTRTVSGDTVLVGGPAGEAAVVQLVGVLGVGG